MAEIRELPGDELYRRTDPDVFGFETTAEMPRLTEIVGQPRATAALDFGVGIDHGGFNVFALGSPGTGKHHAVYHYVETAAAARPVPPDRCYVHNFQETHRPRLLTVAPGRGRRLAADVEQLVRELGSTLAAAFESEEYQARRGVIEEELREQQSQVFDQLQEQASHRGLTALRSPGGIVFAPQREGEVVEREKFLALSEDERNRIEKDIEAMQGEVEKALRQVPAWQREHRRRVLALNTEITQFAVAPLFEDLARKYADEAAVVAYLAEVRQDVVENARDFLRQQATAGAPPEADGAEVPGAEGRSLRRYAVNVVVDRSDQVAAPIVCEDHPTYANLIGRVEYLPRMGALVTDFQLIKAGSLARADGGYLVVEVDKLLRQPFAYEGLKRALAAGQVKIESPSQAYSLISTVSLEPEPMPLEVKVVLVGDRALYYLLAAHDPEFGELFKVAADFSDLLERDVEGERTFGRLVASLAQQEDLPPFTKHAVARVLEHASRMLGDAEKLSTQTSTLCDVLREAAHWAGKAGHPGVGAEDVQRALDQRIYRVNRVEERLREEILRQTVLIDTAGERTGTVNGLAVLALGGYGFGRPSRITARVRMGGGEVVNIEREVKLSGPLHSKGVLILSSFLSARYAAERPLSLAASLVFEQSYGGVDGDSASSAELYALLSAVAEAPIRQGIAVTGSVNQHGEVQAIGGVNEKVEGFFAVCEARGLTGYQGVLIPASNVKHLMLRREVVEAVAAGRFHVWAVDHVDQGIEVLTGVAAGERQADGTYPAGSINGRVEARLEELSEKRRRYNARGKGDKEGPDKGDKDEEEPRPPQPEPPPAPPEPPAPAPGPTPGPEPPPEGGESGR